MPFIPFGKGHGDFGIISNDGVGGADGLIQNGDGLLEGIGGQGVSVDQEEGEGEERS